MAIDVDMGGLDLHVNSVYAGATTPGATGTNISSAEIGVLDNASSANTGTTKAVITGTSGALTVAGLLTASGGITVPTAKTVAVTDTVGFTANTIILPIYELVRDVQNQVAAASYAVSHPIFVNDSVSGTYKVVGASAVFGTASSSGTLNIEVATGTQAIGAGTNQMSSTMSLSGSANTVVNGTITTQTTISAGARINLIFAGTVTNLLNCTITVVLQRLT